MCKASNCALVLVYLLYLLCLFGCGEAKVTSNEDQAALNSAKYQRLDNVQLLSMPGSRAMIEDVFLEKGWLGGTTIARQVKYRVKIMGNPYGDKMLPDPVNEWDLRPWRE